MDLRESGILSNGQGIFKYRKEMVLGVEEMAMKWLIISCIYSFYGFFDFAAKK